MNKSKKKSDVIELNQLAAQKRLSPEVIHQLLYGVKPLPPTQIVVVRLERVPGKPPQITVKHPNLLKEHEQLAWTSPDARVEIRFSPALSPFTGAAFEVARGGKVYSGLPTGKFGPRQVVRYKLLVTTPDGILLDKDIEFTVLHPQAPDKPKGQATITDKPAKAKGSRRS